MKPLQLSFQGFNSFSERVDIDFERLTANGLFGIFGKTGSGKSTIIDCIMYALFAKTPRNQTIKEYINNKCNNAFVDFLFEILNDGTRKRYKVSRTIRIGRTGNCDTTAAFYEKIGDKFLQTDTKDVSEAVKKVIGLDYSEFSKCIVLPQNEFAAFVKATRANRLQIVSKLFSLERYDKDLTDALKARTERVVGELNGLDGELSQLASYSDERIRELKAEEKAIKTHCAELKKEYDGMKEKIDAGAAVYEALKRLEKNEAALSELNAKKERIEELRRKAKLKDAAEKVAEAAARADESKKNRDLLETQIKRETERADRLGKEITLLTADAGSENMERVTELVKLSERLASNRSTAEEREKLAKKYGEAKRNYDREEELLGQAKQALGRNEIRLAALGNPSEKTEKLLGRTGQFALAREIKSEIKYINELLARTEKHKDEPFGGEMHAELSAKADELDKRYAAISSLTDTAADISDELAALNEEREEFDKLTREISAAKERAANSENRLKELKEDLERIGKEGSEKSEKLKKLGEEVGADVRSADALERAINAVEREKKAISEKIRLREENKRKFENELSALKESLAAKKERLAHVQSELEEREKSLSDALCAGGFESVASAVAIAKDVAAAERYDEEINRYDKDLNEALAIKSRLSAETEGCGLVPGEYEKSKEEADEKFKEISDCNFRLSSVKTALDIALEKAKERKEVSAKREDAVHRKETCDKLAGFLSNHTLLNFIAEEYLSEISERASTTLLLLTSGRYDVVYDREFFVTDNMNCGERRSVTTLSGGETFLVSLSLALALSSAICEKTRRPVEFFFLDEGFGTLDSDLTDIVLNSLDKLKSEHFAIGLISHVPELRQRISSKIIVKPATALSGSKAETVFE